MSLILSTRSIRVEIAQPGEFPNTTTRFDRAGFVTGVTLEDRYQVCAREPDHLSHPSTGGMGLCSEFRLPRPAQEAKAGEWFPKPGVGLLRKDAEGGYVLHQRYPCEPFEVLTQRAGDSVTFLTLPKPCGGYAMQQEKTLRVSGNALAMEITLTNTGSQALELEEYCHNFITIERLPLGEGYSLAMPVVSQDGKAPRRGEALMGRGKGFTFRSASDSAAMMDVEEREITSETEFRWTLTHRDSPVRVSEEVSRRPHRVVVWAVDHIVSPEVFCQFCLLPGQRETWTRTWTFDC